MNLLIAAIGKAGNDALAPLMKDYQQRCGWPIELREYQSKQRNDAKRRMEEVAWLFEQANSCEQCWLMDRRGKDTPSEQLASTIQRLRDHGTSSLAILIGGADGFTEQERRRADKLIAFGSQTWPHMLARTMLFEQLYRAWAITSNHPYHRAG